MARKKIPDNIEAEVMFKSDRLCCVCRNQGDQIHHLDSKPDNNSLDNLVFLCFKHHDEASKTGGLSRKLSSKTIIKYREQLYKEIELKRHNALKPYNKSIKNLTTEDLLDASLAAIAILEIAEIKVSMYERTWKYTEEDLHKLYKFSDLYNLRIIHEIFILLRHFSTITRHGMPPNISSIINILIVEYLPINFTKNEKERIIELTDLCINIAFNISYDAAIHLRNLAILEDGLQIFKYIYKVANEYNLSSIEEKILSNFKELYQTLQRPERKDLDNAKELLIIYQKDLPEKSMLSPLIPEHLYNIILEQERIDNV